jgi:hypothetical protein
MTDDHLVPAGLEGAEVNQENPWPGLEAYSEADRKFFHGRQLEIDELMSYLARARLTVFFGQSGLGKTSLLQAGVFHRIRQEQAFPIYIRLDFSANHQKLTDQVKQIIDKEAKANGVEAPPSKDGETLWEYFHRQEADFWNQRNKLMLPVLVFDQFEEIFTLGREDADSKKASEAFLIELGDLIEGRPPAELKEEIDANPDPLKLKVFAFNRHHYKILLSLREDFLHELEVLKKRIPSIMTNRFQLPPMNGEAAFEVVAKAKELIEEEVAKKVVRFVAAAENSEEPLENLVIEPGLLSVVCRELNLKRQKRQREGKSLITADLVEGNQKEIVSDFYERSLADLKPEVRVFVEDKLLTVSGYRSSEALDNALQMGVTQEAIESLIKRRLIRREERQGRQRLELTHDLLKDVVAASRDQRKKIEEERELKEKIAEKLRREQEVKSKRTLLKWLSAIVFFNVVSLIAFVITMHYMYEEKKLTKDYREAKEIAEKEKKNAEEEKQKAIAAREETNQKNKELNEKTIELENAKKFAEETKEKIDQQYKKINKYIQLSKIISSDDIKSIKNKIHNFPQEKNIKFKATGDYDNKIDIWDLKVFPDEASIPGGFGSIAKITYYIDGESSSNKPGLISEAEDFGVVFYFKGNIPSNIIVFIEYSENKTITTQKINIRDIFPQKK